MQLKTPLHYLVSPSGARTIAHCLDYDLVVSADTYHEALRRLTLVVGAHARVAQEPAVEREVLEHQAPEMYWRKFNHLRAEQHSEESVCGVICEVAQSTSRKSKSRNTAHATKLGCAHWGARPTTTVRISSAGLSGNKQ